MRVHRSCEFARTPSLPPRIATIVALASPLTEIASALGGEAAKAELVTLEGGPRTHMGVGGGESQRQNHGGRNDPGDHPALAHHRPFVQCAFVRACVPLEQVGGFGVVGGWRGGVMAGVRALSVISPTLSVHSGRCVNDMYSMVGRSMCKFIQYICRRHAKWVNMFFSF